MVILMTVDRQTMMAVTAPRLEDNDALTREDSDMTLTCRTCYTYYYLNGRECPIHNVEDNVTSDNQ